MAKTDYTGQTLEGRYRVIRLLGEGGMGAVYLGEHAIIGKRVAIKLLHTEFSENEQVVKRFIGEARTAAAIGHKNIIDVMDVGVSYAGEPYVVMEYLEGESLASLLDREKRLDLPAASAILEPVLLGLSAAHQKGIVHRDLKPDNIFLVHRPDEAPAVKIIDFGIAKFAFDKKQSRITRPEEVFGTPSYMSPEQIRSSGEVDQRSDLFSMGIILYEMLVGELPFAAENNAGLILQIMTADPRPPQQLFPDFPALVEPVLRRALAKSLDERFQNAAEMLDSIRELTTSVERQQRLTQLSTGMKRGVARGDLGTNVKSGRGHNVAAEVISGITSQATPKAWARAITLKLQQSKWYWGLGGLLLVVVVAGFSLWKPASGSTSGAAPLQPSVALAPSPILLLDKTESTARTEEVQITVAGAPDGATITYDGAIVPMNPFRVKRGNAIAPLRVDKPGFGPFSYAVLPSQNRVVEVTLKELAEIPPSRAASPLPVDQRHTRRSDIKERARTTTLTSGSTTGSPPGSAPKKAKLSKGGRGTVFGKDFE